MTKLMGSRKAKTLTYFAPKLGRKHKNETLADADADTDADGDGDGGDAKRHRRRGRGRGRDDEVTKHFFLRR